MRGRGTCRVVACLCSDGCSKGISEGNGATLSWPEYKIYPDRARKEGRSDNQIYLLNRQEWAIIDNGWLLVDSVNQRF